jgi:hypothetical protein
MALRMEFDRREHPVGRAVCARSRSATSAASPQLIEAGRRDGSLPAGRRSRPRSSARIEGLRWSWPAKPHDEALAERVTRRPGSAYRDPMDAALERYSTSCSRAAARTTRSCLDRTQRLRNVEPETARMLPCSSARPARAACWSSGPPTATRPVAGRRDRRPRADRGARRRRARQARETFATAGFADAIELAEADGGRCSPTARRRLRLRLPRRRAPALHAWWPDLLRTHASRGPARGRQRHLHAGEVEAFRALVDAEPRSPRRSSRSAPARLLVTARR